MQHIEQHLWSTLKGALQTALVGSLAAGVAYLIGKFIA
jgi:hypothetical protein